jgi:hypothetical protein
VNAHLPFSSWYSDLLSTAWAFIDMVLPHLLKLKTQFLKKFRYPERNTFELLVLLKAFSYIFGKHAKIRQRYKKKRCDINPVAANKNTGKNKGKYGSHQKPAKLI